MKKTDVARSVPPEAQPQERPPKAAGSGTTSLNFRRDATAATAREDAEAESRKGPRRAPAAVQRDRANDPSSGHAGAAGGADDPGRERPDAAGASKDGPNPRRRDAAQNPNASDAMQNSDTKGEVADGDTGGSDRGSAPRNQAEPGGKQGNANQAKKGKGKKGPQKNRGGGNNRRGGQHVVSPPKPGDSPAPILPPARAAHRKRRHYGVLVSFLLLVVLPVAVAAWYLYARAADQYASTMGFTVRKEETANAAELFGGITDLGSGSTSDSDVLYEFIQSQGLVESVDAKLDLRRIYSIPENDPVFSIDPDAPIEELVEYWGRMVKIYYDSGTGLIQTRVLAFTPDDAQAISQEILDESTEMINRLTAVARDDSTRYAREELDLAEERLRNSRSAMTEFRARTQIVDPNIDIQGQMGLLTNLQAQLAEALIELDLLNENTRAGDPRIRQAEQRIAVIQTRIAEERNKFGIGEVGQGPRAYASLVGEYETLVVDREFAEQAYLAALANFDAAQADAQRKTRYLAAYSLPTLAQSSEYPQREVLLGLFALFITAAWAVGTLVYYSVRDRR